ATLHPGAARHKFRANHHFYRIIGLLRYRRTGIADNTPGRDTPLPAFLQRTDHIGRRPAGRHTYDNIIVRHAVTLEIQPALLRVVLGILHRLADGRLPARDDADDQIERHPISRRYLAGIQYAQPAARA